MSRTATGRDVKRSGGSFSGKNTARTLSRNDAHNGLVGRGARKQVQFFVWLRHAVLGHFFFPPLGR